MTEIEAYYYEKKGAKIVRVQGMDEFLSIDDDDDNDDVIIGTAPIVSAPGDMPFKKIFWSRLLC